MRADAIEEEKIKEEINFTNYDIEESNVEIADGTFFRENDRNNNKDQIGTSG